MIISHKYKFIFIKTFKVAGTSIEIFLSQFCGPDDIITPIYPQEYNHLPRNYLDHDGKTLFHNHISARAIQKRVEPEIWNRYYKFCFERNPWDKTVSHYHFIRKSQHDGQLSFDDYMERDNFCVNYLLYTNNNKEILVDKIAKYENIQDDLQEIMSSLRMPIENKLNIYAKSDYRLDKSGYQSFFLGKRERYIERIGLIFNREIELHGYIF